MDEVEKDKRFSHITSDPRFRKMPQKQRKMKIDHRFQSMFHDKKFKLKYSVDKRGKPVHLTTNENLRRYYELSDSEDGKSDSDLEDASYEESVVEKLTVCRNDLSTPDINKRRQKLKKYDGSDKFINRTKKNNNSLNVQHLKNSEKPRVLIKKKQEKSFKKPTGNEIHNYKDNSDSENCESSSVDIEQEDESEASDSELSDSENSESSGVDTEEEDESEASDGELSDVGDGPDLARGEGLQETSEEETDSDFSEDKSSEHDQSIDHKWGELDKDAPEATELGKRLALCNMDWDRIKAADLFLLFQSFIRTGGSVLSVQIYPSEYGQKRMKEEAVRGPTEFIKDKSETENDIIEDDEGNTYNKEKLRQYQINRLKYYYAVIEFDSVATASHVYDECDGLEYETSSARLDLRFIPDDMTFDQEIKDGCAETPDSCLYKPSNFFTSALCQFKVDLTWDETNNDRIKLTTKKFTKDDVKEDNFKAFLASGSDEETNYRRRLNALEESDDSSDFDDEKQIEKYISLIQEIKSEEEKKVNDVEMEISWEPGLKETAENLVKKKKQTENNTPWEDYLQKRRDKKIKKQDSKKAKEHNPEMKSEASEKLGNAFSDDDLPDDFDPNDPFFKHEDDDDQIKVQADSKKTKKVKRKKEKLSEDKLKEQKREEAELDLLLLDEKDNRKHFNLKDLIDDESTKKKKKRKVKKWKEETKTTNDDFKINVGDSRFEAMYTSHLFNIDPSAPEFKDTKGMKAIIDEKMKRRQKKTSSDDKHELFSKRRKQDQNTLDQKETERDTSNDIKKVKDTSLSMLVKSVKAKTEKYQMKRKK